MNTTTKTKKFPMSPANIAALQAIVDAATKTGTIETDALKSMVEAVHRQNRMHQCVAYLATKKLQPIEKARIAKLLKAMQRNDERSLDKLAAPYKLGDILQMADALQSVPLNNSEERALDRASSLRSRVYYGESIHLTWEALRGIVAKHDVKINLITKRIELLRGPEPASDRTSLARFLPMPA
ncbi:hypothetical protein GUK30_32615 [Rhizobium leguminosarum]|uniref:hypothetical protein n=1 Tax=Rhizobium ruizarguesonis TaxID=2081791 RepID=UPI0013C18D15|nr:hypothetical protein [Rhizobium ruizarguesonis]NEI24091.1 hypothetical protein [Rhizobium ruizarguesonis]